jgi:glycosyltransferase involved in cell wall biosynthesis
MLSIIIPSRNEKFLNNTISELLLKARGDIEIIVILDGYWEIPIADERVHYIHFTDARGMRNAINQGVALSRQKYIMKIDGHCMVDEGFDLKLIADCEPNWVVIPRRKRLDADNWKIQDVGKPDIDYMYLSYPNNPKDFGGASLHGRVWDKLNKQEELKNDEIVDLMSFQGSCWFMHRDYFYELELMDEKNYGQFANEAQEIGLKSWLSGGRVVRNKKTWYAHLHKGKKHGRGYFLNKKELDKGAQYTKKWLTDSAWSKQTLPFKTLIKRFWPVPDWPQNYVE